MPFPIITRKTPDALTDLVARAARRTAVIDALRSGNARIIASVLFAEPAEMPPTSPERPEDYDARPMAIHSAKRLVTALEHGYHINRDELDILLNFLYEVQSDLEPRGADDAS